MSELTFSNWARVGTGSREIARCVVLDGSELVGSVDVENVSVETAFIHGMWVAAPRRGAGIGTTLIEKALLFVKGWAGVRHVNLTVDPGNPRARSFYERNGFEGVNLDKSGVCFMSHPIRFEPS